MKLRYSAATAISALLIMFFVSCDNPFSKEWAAKIGSDVITIKDFNQFYYTQNRMVENVETNEDVDKLAQDPVYVQMHQFLNKQYFLETLINGKLIYSAATEDDSINQDELNTVIELSKYQIVMQYYLIKKLKSKIVVTDEEVNEFYTRNKDKLSKYTANEAIEICRKELEQRKLYAEMSRYVEELKQKKGVNRDGFKDYMSKQNK